MDQKKLGEFRERLLSHKQSLLDVSEANENATETVELDQTRQGRLSRMDAMQGQAMSIAASNRRSKEIVKIDQALERIEQNYYGICQMCDEEIALKRLELNPAVTYCIHCAEKLENE